MASNLFDIIKKSDISRYCTRTHSIMSNDHFYNTPDKVVRFLNWLHFVADCGLIGIDKLCFLADSVTHTMFLNPCDNIPDATIYHRVVANVKQLDSILTKFYEYNGPFNINSWYRNDCVNLSVGGARHSLHRLGAAVDIAPENINDYNRFKCNVYTFVRNNPMVKAIYYPDGFFVHLELINPVFK